MVQWVVIYIIRWADEQVPVFLAHAFGQGRFFSGYGNALWPYGAVGPDVDGVDFTDQAFVQPRHHLFLRRVGGTLVTHLRHHFVFAGGLGEHPGFADVVGKWLLYVYVFAQLHCCHSCHPVYVIGGRYGNGIDIVFHFFQHHPEIGVLFGGRKLVGAGFCPRKINITKGDYIIGPIVPGVGNVGSTLTASTNRCDVEFVTRGNESSAKYVPGHNGDTAQSQGRILDKFAP